MNKYKVACFMLTQCQKTNSVSLNEKATYRSLTVVRITLNSSGWVFTKKKELVCFGIKGIN